MERIVMLSSVIIILLMAMVIVGQAYAMTQYERGYRNGCADRIKRGLHLNLALNPDYGQGYEAGWGSCFQ